MSIYIESKKKKKTRFIIIMHVHIHLKFHKLTVRGNEILISVFQWLNDQHNYKLHRSL